MALRALLVAAAVALLVTPVFAALARRRGIVDRPGPLKVQDTPVPYLGGMAVLVAFVAGGGTAIGRWVIVPVLVAGLGLIDDLRPIGPLVRLAGEAGLGVLCAAMVGGPPSRLAVGAVTMVALTNIVNLLDGLDAVATVTTAISAMGLAAIGDDRVRTVGIALVGALLGFMVYNRPPARIYLGDSGSYLIGGVLTTLILGNWADGDVSTSALIVVPLVIAIPLADTTIAVVRRWRSGQPIMTGDRSHIYDQLVARGVSVLGTATLCAAAQATCVLAAYFAAQSSEVVALSVVGAGLAALAGTLVVAGFVRPQRGMPA